MRLSRSTTHGVLALGYLDHRQSDAPAACAEIAEAMVMPPEQASKVMQALAASNLVDSVRGRSGGYVLTRDLADISLLEVSDAMHGEFTDDQHTSSSSSSIADSRSCCVSLKLDQLYEELRGFLAGQSLAKILRANGRQGE